MKGKVKWFNEIRGFGFIVDDNEIEYFVHISNLQNKELIKEGDLVRFEIKKTDRGHSAFNVSIIKG